VVKRDDGTFDLFLNQTLDRSAIPETWLPEELCLRFGFCGEEISRITGHLAPSSRHPRWHVARQRFETIKLVRIEPSCRPGTMHFLLVW